MPKDRNTAFILGVFSDLLGHLRAGYLSSQSSNFTIGKGANCIYLLVLWQEKIFEQLKS